MMDGDVISECVYLSALVIAYNPAGCFNKGIMLFNFWADCTNKLKRQFFFFFHVGAILFVK